MPKKKRGRPKGSKNKSKPDRAGVDKPQATHYTIPIEGGGRADKGKKRGPHKSKEPPIPVNPLPPVTSQTSSATRERTQHQAGGVRARGQTLAGAFTPQEPVGGWSGIDPSVDLDWQSSMTSGGKTKSSEIQEEITEMNKKYKWKVDKLDHKETNPKSWTNAKIDSFIMDREIAKRDADNFGEEQAQNWWAQKREQEKASIRKQERTHHEIMYGKDRDGLIEDLDSIHAKIIELEEEQAREEGRAYKGGGRVGPEKKAELMISKEATGTFAEQIRQIDQSTTGGKMKALAMIDLGGGARIGGPIEEGEEETRTLRTLPAPSRREETQTPLEGQTLKPQEGITDTQRLFGTYAYGLSAGLGSAGIALGAVAPSLVSAVGEGYKNHKEREREKERVREVIQSAPDKIRDAERRKQQLTREQIRKTQETGREKVKAGVIEKSIEREKELKQARKVGKEVKEDIIEGGFRKIDFPEDKGKDVAQELKKDILEGAFSKISFPAEAKNEEEQVEVGRLNRRRQGHEIFGSFGHLETTTEERLRKQREEERMKWAKEKVSKIRDKAKDQYLKDKSKSIHERLREEERKSAHHRLTEPKPPSIVDDIMGGATEKTISFVPTKRTPQPEPEPEDDSTDYDTAEEATDEEDDIQMVIEDTDPEDWESQTSSEADIMRLQRRPGVGLFAGEHQIRPVLKLKQKPVLKLKGGKTLKLTPKTEEEFVKAQGPPPKPPPAPAFPQTPSALQPDEDTPPPPFRSEPPQPATPVLPQTTARYARGATEKALGAVEGQQHTRDKDRLRELKGYLYNQGFRSALVDSRSRKDRSSKDRIIEGKLNDIKGSGEYEKIKKAIAEAIIISKRIGKAQQKAQQQKKKKKKK